MNHRIHILVVVASLWSALLAVDLHATDAVPTTEPSTKPIWRAEGVWTPLSRVYDRFGTMTVTSDRVTWNSGQTCGYILVNRDDRSVLLRLEPPPVLHNRPYPFMRFQPRAENRPFTSDSEIEVSLFEGEDQARENKPETWGVYLLSNK